MHWLFLLLAFGALAVAIKTSSMTLMVVCLLASLGLFIAWVMAWYAVRVGNTQRDETQMIDPVELRRLREAKQRQQAGTDSGIVGVSAAALMMASESSHHAAPHASVDAGDSGGDSD